ncbi:RsmB/NOP family class I SAM-dependent RNA methyltransferase [Treponema sp. Marseille-Q4132]|uniref:RsmB/NOP family class I SAM-dependent RNA methyltransferase n=1 Tax=Treponema sp. Marseille-Q4132 TaxID=2766701 RepID=UPI001652EAD3|nr:RsmB/NOP family class I SAM-dependent RNA methyltransferase [Treponema sp. Marseille-Q4132]QNL97771.1 RsmB/NOP family class I SAM-dependent RNA methyltransferase [Treponema sp. Marseille-Q4132]
MRKDREAQKLSGRAGFEAYYSALYGERWPKIREALSGDVRYAAWNAGGKEPYFLDAASVLAAFSLPLSGAHTLLDLCAAPGGKTLVLASLMEEDAMLVANERSRERCRRLKRVLENCLCETVFARVKASLCDGAKMCLDENARFDRILLDAPCSSERHVFTDAKYLAEWTPSRIKTSAIAQWALLSSAYRMLNPEGYILYSTCALAPAENDGIVERLLKKFDTAKIALDAVPRERQRLLPFCDTLFPEAEKTKYGFHVLPDVQRGAGPIYFSLIRKTVL